MNTTFKVARMSLNRCWRFVSHKARNEVPSLRRLPAVSGQKRRYADRYTFDDKTQEQIEGMKRSVDEDSVPKESPWRDGEWTSDFPERLDELGYESHCNDRLYIAKNKFRHDQERYQMEREERREEAQKRFQSHFAHSHQPEQNTVHRRTIMQDPADHQKRQEAIIEQNRRRWQSRPESRRETNTSGITYRPEARKQKYMEEKLQRESEDFFIFNSVICNCHFVTSIRPLIGSCVYQTKTLHFLGTLKKLQCQHMASNLNWVNW